MNILLATYSYFPYDFGGTEVYVSGLAKYLTSLGHHVQIIAATSEKAFNEHPVFYADHEIKAVNYSYDNVSVLGVMLNKNRLDDSYEKYRPIWISSWIKIISLFDIDKWDLLHMNCNTAAVGLATMEAVRYHSNNVRVIASYHIPQACTKNTLLLGNAMQPCKYKASEKHCVPCLISTKTNLPLSVTNLIAPLLPGFSKPGFPMLLRLKYLVGKLVDNFRTFDKGIDKWICFSADMKKHLEINGVVQEKISVIRHGIEDSIFRNLDDAERKSGRFIYVGRLTKYKGIFTLLAAWLKLDKKPGKELIIIGREHLEDQEVIEWRNITKERDDIKWFGEKSNKEVADLMRQSSCVIIPSEWIETGPLVFHEAIACGADVIASNIGGCKELASLYSEKSETFEVGNVDQLAGVICNFKFSGKTARVETSNEHYAEVSAIYNR